MTQVLVSAENADKNADRSGEVLAGHIAVPEPTNAPAKLTFSELRDALRHRYDDLTALEIEYVFDVKSFDGDLDRVPNGYEHFAFSADKRFKAQSGTHDGKEVYPHAIWAWNGEIQQSLHPIDEQAYIEAEKQDWLDSDMYLSNAGIPVESLDAEWNRVKQSCCRPWVHHLFDGRWHWEVMPKLEIVDGCHCHLLVANGRLRVWVDADLGFAIRFLEWPDLARSAFRDFRRIGNAMWLPWRTETVQYTRAHSSPGPSESNQPAYTAVHEIQRMAVNADVSDELFTLQFSAGTVVRDQAHKRFYQIGDNNEEIKLGDWPE
jgi:hypothetical protein